MKSWQGGKFAADEIGNSLGQGGVVEAARKSDIAEVALHLERSGSLLGESEELEAFEGIAALW